MTSAIQDFFKSYRRIMAEDKYADPRTKDTFLISDPVSMFILLAGYVYFCKEAGPRLMKNREPLQLKKTMILYNFAQIILSVVMFYKAILIWKESNWWCQPLDYSESPFALQTLQVCKIFYFAKIAELLDTVFFVLRKKYNQVTYLHLFHHTFAPTVAWVGFRYFAGGHGSLFVLTNPFVHIIMYSYYLIAGLGSKYQKYLWWKKHLTTIQIIQFACIFVHNIPPLFNGCQYPKILNVLNIVFNAYFFYLFSLFYINAYVKKSKTKDSKLQ